MTHEEMNIKIGEIADQITQLEKSKNEIYAELGKKVFPNLADGEYPDIVEQIKLADEKMNALRDDQDFIEAEYKRIIESYTCFLCKTVNNEGAVFCAECGAKLGAKPREYCEKCETMNNPGQKFCGECGAKLREETE